MRQHAEIVIERAMARQLIAAADGSLRSPRTLPHQERRRGAKRIMALSDSATLGAGAAASGTISTSLWSTSGGNARAGISTGFPDLDRRTWWWAGRRVARDLAGRPGNGQDRPRIFQVAYNVADHGQYRAGVLTREMQDTQLIDRAVAFVGRVPLAALLTGEG